MVHMEVKKLIDLRFLAQNKLFLTKLETLKRTQNLNGALNSGNTIALGYDELVFEFKKSSETILNSLQDVIVGRTDIDAAEEFKALALITLSHRKKELEDTYQKSMSLVISGFGDSESLKPYFNLESVFELTNIELEVSVAKLRQKYKDSLGKNYLEVIKNQFLNRPLVVIAVIIISAVTAILSFIKILDIGCKLQ
jgi:hypothetical protein